MYFGGSDNWSYEQLNAIMDALKGFDADDTPKSKAELDEMLTKLTQVYEMSPDECGDKPCIKKLPITAGELKQVYDDLVAADGRESGIPGVLSAMNPSDPANELDLVWLLD